jgi:transposase
MCNINLGIDFPGAKVIKTEKDQRGNLLITVETTEDHVACRICNKKIYKQHGVYRERKLKHLPAFGTNTFIIYSPHRYICEDFQDNPTTTATPSWHSQNGLHTTEYENHLLMELVNSTIADVAIKECITEDAVLRVVIRRIASKVNWNDIKSLGVIGIDEISLKKGYKDFVTIITSRVDGKITLLAVLDGRKKAIIKGFLKEILIKLRKTIITVCIDMYDGYINAVNEVFKGKVMVVVDRFHVAKLYRTELDKFRQKTLKQLKQELTIQQYDQIIGATRILRKVNECLTEDEKRIVNLLFSYAPELMEAYALAIKLTQTFNTHLSKEDAVVKFNEWIALGSKSKLICFNKFITTLRKWKNEIANYFVNRHTSVFVEGLNNKIKVLKRRCYGIYNLKHFFQRLFLDLSDYQLYAVKIEV